MKPPYLAITVGGATQQLQLGAEPVTIGRQIGNMIVVEDTLASRFHCVIEKTATGYRMRDLGSRNGTRVNGQLQKVSPLRHEDVVNIGATEFKLMLSEPKPNPTEMLNTKFEQAPGFGGKTSEDAPVDSLNRMADALPDKPFNHFDLALLSARGHVAHAAGVPARKKDDDSGEAVTLLRLLLLVCFRTRASDIHIEPKNDIYLIRVRIDGTMVDAAKLKKEMGVKLASVVKVISDIDIAQRNVVQEGHFGVRTPDRRVDYRVSFTPAMHGQKCVIRILDAVNSPRYLWDLGLPEWMFTEIERTIKGDSGMVLVCGPTGSGKTASLYAVMRSIDSGERNVVTIEDPVEIQIEGITQMPVNEDQGNTFPALLRSVLRQDPDVILVGEVRDSETARTAIQSAMTGHLVFSTIHARDTLGTVFRLLDLGIEPYLVASGLQLILAQRLARKLCPQCRVGQAPKPDELARLEPVVGKVSKIYRATGCAACLHTGYAGRRAIFELLVINESIREVMQKAPSPADLQRAIAETKFVKLMHSGYELVAEGLTTLEEVERVIGN